MAKIRLDVRTLSRKPWYLRKKPLLEGELFETRIAIINDGSSAFPPSDMRWDFGWEYSTGQRNPIKVELLKESLAPGQEQHIPAQRRRVLAPGSVLLKLNYRPFGHGCILNDTEGEEINPVERTALKTVRATSVVELQTLAGLYLAAVAATISAVGLVLAILVK
jgi:hypothetical protein